jgi:phage terminase small subunit
MSDRPLNRKQQQFVREYVVDMNATAAAERAGYSCPSIGRQLITQANVASAVKAALDDKAKANALTVAFVLSKLRENLDRAMQAIPVLDKEGNPTGEYKYDGAVANRAAELLGKHLGMFPDRTEVAIDKRVTVEIVEEVIHVLPAKEPAAIEQVA